MPGFALKVMLLRFRRMRKPLLPPAAMPPRGMPLGACAVMSLLCSVACAQQADSAKTPTVVQPGAPGKPSKSLPASTRGTLPQRSPADVEFMQGMIMHHCAGRGDDGDDPVAHGEQGTAVAGGADQQLAVGRNHANEAVADGARQNPIAMAMPNMDMSAAVRCR